MVTICCKLKYMFIYVNKISIVAQRVNLLTKSNSYRMLWNMINHKKLTIRGGKLAWAGCATCQYNYCLNAVLSILSK